MVMRAAESVLRSYWNGLLPVKPDVIAEKMGIEVRPLDPSWDSRLSGIAETTPYGVKIIGYNPNDYHGRIRFTIAHELGHHVLGHTAKNGTCYRDTPDNYSSHEDKWLELDANKFAAEILMPHDAVRVMIERKGISDTYELARIFDVSEPAMYWRLKNLNYL